MVSYHSPSEQHIFFIYAHSHLASQKTLRAGAILTIVSKELAHRLTTILRLRPGEKVQLFSQTHSITVTLQQSERTKDTVVGYIEECTVITPPQHQLISCIGLLKKESFEEAVHHATVTGATHIQPIITQKSRRGWLNEREPERLQGIIIAAAEQSKNPHLPILQKPLSLDTILSNTTTCLRIGFEATSTAPLSTLINSTPISHDIALFIGPEGGFTEAEITSMKNAGTVFYQLTKTILRSQEAVCLATGVLSTVIHK